MHCSGRNCHVLRQGNIAIPLEITLENGIKLNLENSSAQVVVILIYVCTTFHKLSSLFVKDSQSTQTPGPRASPRRELPIGFRHLAF